MPPTASTSPSRYKFGDLVLEIGPRRVSRGQDIVELGGLTFDLLRTLAESAPNVVSHDELAERVWRGRPVNPETITQRAMMLRHALSDDADQPRYFEAIRGQGYRLIPDVETLDTDGAKRSPWMRPRVVAVSVVACLALTMPFAWRVFDDQYSVLPNSIAILPFKNLSPDPNNDYFAAGIHESTLNQLAKIRDLTVIARTSVLQYEDNPPPIPEIAEALKVEMVMEGSVRYANDRVLITAQLIDGRTGGHLWSAEYNRDLSDIFGVQAEIAENIAMALEAELLPSELQRIERPATASTEAYALFLRAAAVRIIPPTPPEEIETYHSNLDQALEIDPNFARAYALKARDYAMALRRPMRVSDQVTYDDWEALAREHAERALALDEDEGIAYAVLAQIHLRNRREAEGRSAFEQALALSPNDRDVLTDFAYFNAYAGNYEVAIDLAKRASERGAEPGDLWRLYLLAGDYNAAESSLRDELTATPSYFVAQWMLGILAVRRGDSAKASEQFQLAERLGYDEDPVNSLGKLVYGYGRIGRHEDALRHFSQFEELASEYKERADTWALAYLGIGETGQAFGMLSTIAEDPVLNGGLQDLHRMKANRYSDPILDQPEFVDVRRRLGFRQ